jgi:hypothetical protein
MTGKLDWGLVIQQGRIVGIYSRSNLVPYKQQGFNKADAKMVGVKSYQEWVFGYGESNEQKPSANSALASSLPANQSSSNSSSSVAVIPEPLNTPKDTNPPYSKDEAKAKEILSPGEQDLYQRYYR